MIQPLEAFTYAKGRSGKHAVDILKALVLCTNSVIGSPLTKHRSISIEYEMTPS